MPVETPDQRVLALAARQHGAVTVAQLAAAGLGRHAIALRLPASTTSSQTIPSTSSSSATRTIEAHVH